MAKPISRRELIRRFRNLGFTGPISGGRHQFVEKGELKVRIPNPHKGGNIDWSLVKRNPTPSRNQGRRLGQSLTALLTRARTTRLFGR
jgi:hypothetical protein